MSYKQLPPSHRLILILPSVLAMIVGLCLDAGATVRFWTGGGANNNWNNGANWSTGIAPVANDDLIFQGGASVDVTSLNNTNNYTAGTVFNSITLTGTNYVLRGNQVVFTNSGVAISAQHVTGVNTIEFPIQLGATTQTFECTAAGATLNLGFSLLPTINLNGQNLTFNPTGVINVYHDITGTGNLTKNGSGRLLLGAGVANTYVGTCSVNAGTLELNDTGGLSLVMITGNLNINNSSLVEETEGEQIADTATVTVTGTLDLNNWNDTIGALTLNGGTVTTGTGTLTLGGNVSSLASATTATISGNLSLGGVTRTFNVASGASNPDLLVSANISGTGGAGITKTSSGQMTLSGANTYTGLTTVDGFVVLANDSALGANGFSTNGTVVNPGSFLLVQAVDIGNEFLTLASGVDFRSSGAASWAGPITLNGDVNLNVFAGTFTQTGVISGSGGFTKGQTGTLIFAGSAANTYAGTTTISAGSMDLNRSSFDGSIPGDLVIGDGLTVRTLQDSQIGNSGTITMNLGSILDLGTFIEAVGDINMTGASVTGAGTLLNLLGTLTVHAATTTSSISKEVLLSATRTFDVANGSASPDLLLSGVIGGSGGITKTGAGSMRLSGANSYSGITTINVGTFEAFNDLALGSTAGLTAVNGTAVLYLNNAHVTNEVLTLNSTNPNGALQNNATADWAGNITLSTNVVIEASSLFGIHGVISGPGGFTKIGASTLILAGSSGNTYSGAVVVNSGVLQLSKSGGQPIPGTAASLTIGDDVGGVDADVVRETAANQINANVDVFLRSSGLLDLNNFNDDLGFLTFDGGHITTGTGSVTVNGIVTVNSNNLAQAVIDGRMTLSGIISFNTVGHFFSPDLEINAAISGSGGIAKGGVGELSLTASNSYASSTTVNDGILILDNSYGLGTTAGGTVVNSGGVLALRFGVAVGTEALTLNGTGQSIFGALGSSFGANSWAGNVTLAGNATISVDTGDSLNLSGAIGGAFNLTKTGTGTLTFSGGAANTYSGTTFVNAGTLLLSKSIADGALSGDLVIGDGSGGINADVVRLTIANQIASSSAITLASSGLLDLNDFDDTTGAIGGSGRLDLGSGTLRAGADNGSSSYTGLILGTGGVFKLGTGVWTVAGNNSYSGNTTVSAGALLVNGSQPQSHVTVNGSATLGGSGTVGQVFVFGNLVPGNSPGQLTCSNLTFNSSASDYYVELTGPTAGSGYDQMNVRGTNSLAGATLHVTSAFTAPVAVSNQFVIVNNDGAEAIVGTFNGLANNATFTSGGYAFRINYSGTFDNDVTLTLLDVPGAAVNSQARVWTGNGNHVIDPNECNHLRLVLTNKTGSAMTGISGFLQSTDPNVVVTQPYSSYPNAAGNGRSTNTTWFQISTLAGFVCGNDINLSLIVTSATHGVFTVPFVLPSGVTSVSPSRYDISTTTNVPDVGTIESTNLVAGFAGPLNKVAVSLWLTHTFDADLSLTLISPDGVAVDLSSGNGAGADFGSACSPDANRTTFDDAAGTAITAGAPPFVGTFRPESALGAFAGGTANGQWRLRVTDANGGTLGTLRCWSLFLHGSDCVAGGGRCDGCITVSGNVTTADPVKTGRVNRNGIGHLVCGANKAFSSTVAGSFNYVLHAFTNNTPDAICATVRLTMSGTALFPVAYLNSYDPLNLAINYLGDPGGSSSGLDFLCTTPAGQTLIIVVERVSADSAYTLNVSGFPCPRPTLAINTVAPASSVNVNWPTWAGGFELESVTSLISGAWLGVTNEPIVNAGRYAVTNAAPPTNKFFHLRKP